MRRFELMAAKAPPPSRGWTPMRLVSWCFLACALGLWALTMLVAF